MATLGSYVPRSNIRDPNQQSYSPFSINPKGTFQKVNYHNYNSNSPLLSKSQLQPPNNNSYNNSFKGERVETLNLNEEINHGRNFSQRLYNADPQKEIEKQMKQRKYMEELRRQADQDRARKEQQKRILEYHEKKHQEKFKQQISIQAQKKQPKAGGKDQNYVVLRSAQVNRKKQNEQHSNQNAQINNFTKQENHPSYHVPRIIKRGGYHNQSSLDDPAIAQSFDNNLSFSRQTQNQGRQTKEAYPSLPQYQPEQQRISKIFLFQQNMLKKLDMFKHEIFKTSDTLNLFPELEKVRFKLRAKPLNMDKINSLRKGVGVEDIFSGKGDFYDLPMIGDRGKIYEGDREVKKRKKQKQFRSHKVNNSRNQQRLKSLQNPQNIRQEQEENENSQHLENQPNIPYVNEIDLIQLPVVHKQEQESQLQAEE